MTQTINNTITVNTFLTHTTLAVGGGRGLIDLAVCPPFFYYYVKEECMK